jgi:hypothetical protein
LVKIYYECQLNLFYYLIHLLYSCLLFYYYVIYQYIVTAGCQWLMPVVLTTWEAEIKRIVVGSQPRQIFLWDPFSIKPFTKKGWWNGLRCKSWVQTPTPQKILHCDYRHISFNILLIYLCATLGSSNFCTVISIIMTCSFCLQIFFLYDNIT